MSTLVWDLVQLQRLTGTRAGKLLQLTPAKLDRTGDVWQYNVDGHKTVHHGHSRIVTIGRRSQEILSPRLMELSGTDHEIRGNWGTHHWGSLGDTQLTWTGRRGRWGHTIGGRRGHTICLVGSGLC